MTKTFIKAKKLNDKDISYCDGVFIYMQSKRWMKAQDHSKSMSNGGARGGWADVGCCKLRHSEMNFGLKTRS